MNFQEKCKLVGRSKIGDIWVNTRTGRIATIIGRGTYNSVKLQHESGRISFKGVHYFAGDFDPVTRESPPGTRIGSLVFKAIQEISPQELALGYLRYEQIRKMGPQEFANLFETPDDLDDQVDGLILKQ